MKKFIYVSEFKVGPEATKKQTMLFHTDLAFAISEGYGYIQPKEGPVFQILGPNEIVEVDITEEELAAAAELSHTEPEQVEFGPDKCCGSPESDDYCMHCHNLMLIDQIINNTLLQKADISSSQAYTMLKLAALAKMLNEVE